MFFWKAEKTQQFEEEEPLEEIRKHNDIGEVSPPSGRHIEVLKKNFGHIEFKDAQWKVRKDSSDVPSDISNRLLKFTQFL